MGYRGGPSTGYTGLAVRLPVGAGCGLLTYALVDGRLGDLGVPQTPSKIQQREPLKCKQQKQQNQRLSLVKKEQLKR